MSDALFLVGPHNHIRTVITAAQPSLGYDEKECIGRTVDELFSILPEEETTPCPLKENLHGSSNYADRETTIDGEERELATGLALCINYGRLRV